jgi:hypothetical protein
MSIHTCNSGDSSGGAAASSHAAAAREGRGIVCCPACTGTRLAAAYRVRTVCEVSLSRGANDEITISRPGRCVEPPGAPEVADFDELLCLGCGACVDWEIDHRSLYVRRA